MLIEFQNYMVKGVEISTPTSALVTDTYSYTYDGMNRLTGGTMAGGKGRESVGYDRNGNIRTLTRTATSTVVDNLAYTYTGNRLTRVVDATTTTDGNYQLPGTTDYTYDANGNLKTRRNTNTASTHNKNNITATTYNYLDLPQSVTAVAGNVTYVYDGAGRKLRSTQGIVGQTRDYSLSCKLSNCAHELTAFPWRLGFHRGHRIRRGHDGAYPHSLSRLRRERRAASRGAGARTRTTIS